MFGANCAQPVGKSAISIFGRSRLKLGCDFAAMSNIFNLDEFATLTVR